jgi:hypothetical protein
VIVEHKRDKKDTGPEELTDMREILTNNTNIGSRQLRETIWTVLPLWFTELGVELCRQTLKDGGGVPIALRVAEAIKKFGEIGVREEQLVAKLGRDTNRWDDQDLASLRVVWNSIYRNEVAKEVEFPPLVMTSDQLTSLVTTAAQSSTRSAAGGADSADVADSPTETEDDGPNDDGGGDELPEGRAELERVMFDLFVDGGIGTTPAERQKRLRIITRCLSLPTPLGAVADLSEEQLRQVVTFLRRHKRDGILMSTLGEMGTVHPDRDKG